jgi:hypothetical protein
MEWLIELSENDIYFSQICNVVFSAGKGKFNKHIVYSDTFANLNAYIQKNAHKIGQCESEYQILKNMCIQMSEFYLSGIKLVKTARLVGPSMYRILVFGPQSKKY